ncbi:MAG: hypothetical protein K2Q10_11695, partial [Rhodospirillales bacterium]|nr:hypothetical protein [Rhodospirillales bacterium]
HRGWEERYGTALRAGRRPFANDRDPFRPLKVGFVSGDFGRHPVGYFTVSTFAALDRDVLELHCYSDRPHGGDDLTARIRAVVPHWRDTAALPDALLAERIRADGIDILFDLAGHTAGNRLPVFARKPAPVQVSWAGYVGTTGLAAMDYVLADRFHAPDDSGFVERVLRMPDGYVCYTPPEEAPAIGPLPALTREHVTFGSFNAWAKVTAEVVALWSAILGDLPDSRLLLVGRWFNDARLRGRVRDAFAVHGIAAERLDLRGQVPHAELLAAYNEVDIALDPFPYSGGLTTCEALWMGVPVVTWPGRTFAGRHSLSHLSNVGLTESIAADLDSYRAIAGRLAGDLPHLAELRAGLRPRMAASPLCDAPRFAAAFAGVLRTAWAEWCATV